jgi:hypothetical protein
MLPPGSTPSSVAGILTQIDFIVPVECVRVLPERDATNCSADIRVEDPFFAKRLCEKLDPRRPASGILPHINAVPITAPMPQGSNSRRVDCKKVHCSWHWPFQTVWLNFGNQDIAQKISDRFNAGAYKVLGQKVKGSSSTRGGGFRNPLAWTVVLTEVPPTAKEPDIIRAIPPAIRPRHVELGGASYKVDLDTANAMVKSRLLEVGLLEWWEDATESGGRRAKAKARFREDEDARKAVTLLNGTPLPFNENGMLTLQLVHCAKIKISERIYASVRAKIETEKQVWTSQHLLFIPYDPVAGYRLLKLEGEDHKNVAQAKNDLEKILAGETAMREDSVLWAPSFGMNGDTYRRLQDIEQSLGIVIVRNKRQSRLHLYGPPQKCSEAQKLLLNLAEEHSTTEHIIELDKQKFVWAFHGGFKAISATLGEGVVTLDIVSVPKRILVTGSDEDYELALNMVNDQKEAGGLSKGEAITDKDCCICGTEDENQVRTRCKHAYCADCFENLCFSGATGDKEFCIRCQGDSSKCLAVLALDELQEHLSSNTFENLLEDSLESYIRLHPQDFRYCPTPNCGQVYRTTSTVSVFTCPKCLIPVCTSCHAPHQGITCAEHKDIESGGYAALQKTKRQFGYKDCPKCKTLIEKTYGCNHITCHCGTHICWNCMRTFPDHTSCYSHLNKEHGGIMDVPEMD